MKDSFNYLCEIELPQVEDNDDLDVSKEFIDTDDPIFD